MENELPKGWSITTLGSVLIRMTNGININQTDLCSVDALPISRIETIANEKIDFSHVKYCIPSIEQEQKYLLKKGDILFSHINSDKHLGKTAIYMDDEPLIHGVNLLLLRSDENLYHNKCLNYLLKYYRYTGVFLNLAQRAVNQSSINQKKLSNLEIPLPPLEEQKQIAEKLDKLFAQIESIKKSTERIPELLKNFRQQILTYTVTGKLTGSDLSAWEKTFIGNIGKVKGGKRLPKGEELVEHNTGFPYIRARDLKEGTVLTKNLMYLLPETQEKIKNYIVNTDDVYITIVGAKIGDAGIIPSTMNNANLTENAAKITDLSEKVIPQYLALWLQAPVCQMEIQQSIKSAAQGKLALSRINKLSVYIPPLEQQQEIVSKINSLFNELKTLEMRYNYLCEILDKLPQAILNKAFKGEFSK